MLKSVHTSIVHTGPKPESNPKCPLPAVRMHRGVVSGEGIPQSSEELAALGSTAVGHRRRHTYVFLFI